MTKRDAGRMESADDYPVVAQLGLKWRVIECRDGEQWILQKKSNKWEGRSYCRTSAALRRVVKEHVGDVDLSRRFPQGRRSSAPAGRQLQQRARLRMDQLGPHGNAVAISEIWSSAPNRNSHFRSML